MTGVWLNSLLDKCEKGYYDNVKCYYDTAIKKQQFMTKK